MGAVCLLNYFKYNMTSLTKKCYFFKFRSDMLQFFVGLQLSSMVDGF